MKRYFIKDWAKVNSGSFTSKTIKYLMPCIVLVFLASGKLSAQPTPVPEPTPVSNVPTPFGVLSGADSIKVQVSPESEEYKRTANTLDNDVDDFLDVNNWDGVAANLTKAFVFGHYNLDQPDDLNNLDLSKVSLGFATKLKKNYLALYYEGFINTGWGTNNDKSGNNASSSSYGEVTNNFALFFARDSIGAFRLDVLLNNLSGSKTVTGPSTTTTSNNGFGMTFQWGKNFKLKSATLKPNVALGFLLPYTTKTTTGSKTTTQSGDNSANSGKTPPGYSGAYIIDPNLGGDGLVYFAAGLDLARAVWEFSFDYALYADLGYKNDDDPAESRDGQAWETLSLAAQGKWKLTDKLAASVKPALNFGFYGWGGNYTYGSSSTYYGSYFAFELKPTVDFGVKYQIKEKVSVYGGAGIALLDWRTASKSEGDTSYPAGSAWEVLSPSTSASGTSNSAINLGVTVTPIPALAIEFGFSVESVNNFIDWITSGICGSSSTYTWNTVPLDLGLLIRYKA